MILKKFRKMCYTGHGNGGIPISSHPRNIIHKHYITKHAYRFRKYGDIYVYNDTITPYYYYLIIITLLLAYIQCKVYYIIIFGQVFNYVL